MEKKEEIKMTENVDNGSSILDEDVKKQVIKDLTDKVAGKGKKVLTYTEISDRLGDIDLDKDQMDEIYEFLIGKGIEVVL